jgi:hypothetical protein
MKRPANKTLLLGGGFLLLSALLAWYISKNYELVTDTVDIGFQGEAKRNPLLAAQRLLERLDIPVESRYGLAAENLPLGQNDTLLLWQEEGTVSYLLAPEILAWVKRGGRLLVSSLFYSDMPEDEAENESAEADITSDDPLFADLGMNLFVVKDGHEMSDVFEVDWQGEVFDVEFASGYFLRYPGAERLIEAWSWNDDNEAETLLGAYMLHFDYGQGDIIAFSDMWFVSNEDIGEHEHAAFFRQVLDYPAPVQKVWLYAPRGSTMPPLFEWLWQKAWPLIISLAVLLFFVLWKISRRFGPLLVEPAKERRRILEHLEASGRFLWQNGQHAYLHSAVTRALWQRLEVSHPDWLHLPETALSERLAELSGLSATRIRTALQATNSPQVFLERLQTIDIIIKKL